MKRIALAITLAVASSVWAQAPAQKKDTPKPEAAKAEARKPAAKAEAQKPAAVAKKSRRSQDARHCLERKGNTEIIKCAEEYL